jgi:hypothetical protein
MEASRYITGDGTVRYQLLFTHGPEMAPSFYQAKNGGELVPTQVLLPVTAFYSTKIMALDEAHG